MRRPDRKLRVNFVTAFDPLRREPELSRPDRPESAFHPPTDIYESGESMVVRVEIAGVTAEAVSVAVDESSGRLSISGNRTDSAPEPGRRFYVMEIASGPFVRVVQLPKPVRAEGATASYEDGLLVVRLPLRRDEPSPPRNVPIE